MATLALQTSESLRSLGDLATALTSSPPRLVSVTDIQDQLGRLRVWSANLGVLARGPASLDHRLREAPTMLHNISKLFTEMQLNITEAMAIVHGDRVSFDQQGPPLAMSDDDSSSVSSTGTDSDSSSPPLTELEQRYHEVGNVIDHLFKLSYKIRGPGFRMRPLKAASYTEVDAETGIDLFDAYRVLDHQYVMDAICDARREIHSGGNLDDRLLQRLARATTMRRRKLAYTRRHQRKLATPSQARRVTFLDTAPTELRRQAGDRQACASAQSETASQRPTEQSRQHTILSTTDASAYLQAQQDAEESRSDVSAATTALDVRGRKTAIPPPPTIDGSRREFECSLCFAMCPPKFASERNWRSHVFQDLQPYVCTYISCSEDETTYASRRAWLEHEGRAHRSIWRCPIHPTAAFMTRSSFEEHIDVEHDVSVTSEDKRRLVGISVTVSEDDRTECPLCNIPLTVATGLHNHLANHLERIAVFALPMSLFATEREDASSDVSHDARKSESAGTDLSDLSWPRSPASPGQKRPVRFADVADEERPTTPDLESVEDASSEDGDPRERSTAEIPPRSILKKPKHAFPEDPHPIREGVVPLKDSKASREAPVNARWTKIARTLVCPEALEQGAERFEERDESVIVLRVLTREEIQKYADLTREIRERQYDGDESEEDARNEVQHAVTDASSPERTQERVGSPLREVGEPVSCSGVGSLAPDDHTAGRVLPAEMPSLAESDLFFYIGDGGGDSQSDVYSRRSSVRSSVGGNGTETPLTDISRSAAGSEYGDDDNSDTKD